MLLAEGVESGDEGLRQDLDALVDAVGTAMEGGELPPPASSGGSRLRLLEALRSELVAGWPDEQPLLPVMRAFEAVRHHVGSTARAATVAEVLGPSSRSVLREVAHMLRSPFGSIVMLADTLREQDRKLSPERREKLLAIIHRAALGIATTAGDLLTLIDGDDGGPVRPFSADEVLESVADLLHPVTEVRECELVIAAEAPEGLIGPSGGIARALLGLGLRAALRTRDGEIGLRAAMAAPDRLRLSVTARGEGAVPEGDVLDLLGIFRVDPDGASYTLSAEGMGLAATERLIRAMGSQLRMEGGDGALELSFILAVPATH